jgi:1,4-dihydroxy-2-naphthoate octaprenyltransferase
MQRLIAILRLSRPLYLFLAGLTYFLGAAVARYLGRPPVSVTFWLGFIGMIFAQVSMDLLVEAFRPFNEPVTPGESIADRKAIHDAALYVSIACLTAIAVIAFFLFKNSRFALPALFYLALSLFVVLAYSMPPLRLVDKGYGEILMAIHLGFLIPSISFLLQTGSFHRLLNAAIIPITCLSLAAILVLDFPNYSEDLKYDRRTLLVRMGWERAIPLHHVLVIVAYILFAIEPLLGFSFGLLWPVFLTLPFGLLQIYWLRNIALGAKPIWTLLTYNAISILSMTIYFLTLSFWLH